MASERKLMAIVIPCDHDEDIWLTDLRNPDHRTFQNLVDGLIEFTDLPHGGTLVSNEDARRHRLPLNYRATALTWLMRPDTIGRDYLCGDVVIAGQPDSSGITAAPYIYVRLLATV